MLNRVSRAQISSGISDPNPDSREIKVKIPGVKKILLKKINVLDFFTNIILFNFFFIKM